MMLDNEDEIKVFGYCQLVHALFMEQKLRKSFPGAVMTRKANPYIILKRQYGFKGNRDKVLKEALDILETIIAPRYPKVVKGFASTLAR